MSTTETVNLINQGAPQFGYATKEQFEQYVVAQTGRKASAAERLASNIFNTLFREDEQFTESVGGTKLLSKEAVETVEQVASSMKFDFPSEKYDAIAVTTTRLMQESDVTSAEVFGEPISDDTRVGLTLNLDTAKAMLETGQIGINPHSPINREAQFVLNGFIASRGDTLQPEA